MTRSYYPIDVLPQAFRVVRGANDLLFTEDGREYIDLMNGSGTVFLGHANPAITAGLQKQLEAVWSIGAIPTRIGIEASAAIEGYLAPTHRLAALYSTGMEAAEFALRVARQATGRREVVGFDGSMHGKSLATARLAWPNELVTMPDFHRLPYLPQQEEGAILSQLQGVLSPRSVSAVFLEPLLGSRGGHIPSRAFVERLAALCAEHGTLLVMDEILTGFHRTGPAFLHQDFGVTPDIVLIGKAMGNGFPVSGVSVDRRYPVTAAMLPGSTYAGNPLAASAVVATLREMQALDLPGLVTRIEQTILTTLKDLSDIGIALRGKGALWILELPRSMNVPEVAARILDRGVIASPVASFIRLIPAATIPPDHLTRACDVVREACRAQAGIGR